VFVAGLARPWPFCLPYAGVMQGVIACSIQPAPEHRDDTPIGHVRIKIALNAAGLKTIGKVSEASDATLLSLIYFSAPSS
jgi:hypothetical protein